MGGNETGYDRGSTGKLIGIIHDVACIPTLGHGVIHPVALPSFSRSAFRYGVSYATCVKSSGGNNFQASIMLLKV